MAFLNIPGNSDPIKVLSATGTGAGTTTFVHDLGVEGNYPGELYPAVFIFAITDIVGSFSGLQVNLEWSPITPDVGVAQFQTVGTWTPLTTPVVYFACSSSGIYRLNCTSFVGGTSFNAYVSIASTMPQSTSSGGGGSVTQGTVPWADNITQVAGVTLGATAIANYGSTPAAVPVPGVNAFVTNAASIGGGVQFADNAVSGATPTGTLNMGWDSINSKIRALKVDASQNLLVAVNAALPAGTNVIGHVIVDSFGTAIDVSDRAARLLGVVYGSQAQQLKQTATNFNLQVELATGATLYDARQIRALTSADVVTIVFPTSPIVWIKGNAGNTLDSTIGAATAPTNALATLGVYQTTVPSLTAGQAVAVQVDVTGSHYVDLEGRKATYSAVVNSTSTPTFTAVAGDIAVLPGSASKTIRVTRVEVTLSTSGTANIETVGLVKRSAADTAGTSAAMTIVPHDSLFGAATAAPLLYTAAPTLGAAVGFIRAMQFNDQSASLPGAATWIWTFGDGRGGASGLVLRGTAQELCVNLGGVVATQSVAVSFEWTEDNS